MQLKGKKIYITGGTGGIGVPLVQRLQTAGAEVEVHSRSAHGDLSGDISALCAKLLTTPPDILINLAGYNVFAHCEDQDMEDIIRVNLTVPMRLTQAVLPGMKVRGSGKIVNVGSMTALIPLPHLTGYVAAKAGLKGFSDALRRELAGTDITVTHITPRAVKTAANKDLKDLLNKQTGVRYDSAEYVAHKIAKAIENDTNDMRIGWPERFFAVLNALFPKAVDGGLKKNREIGEKILNQHKNHNTKKESHKAMKIFSITALAILALTLPAHAEMVVPTDASQPSLVVTQEQTDTVMLKITDLQTRWAEIKYKYTDKDKKIKSIEKLEKEAAALVASSPDRPEAKIWYAIILSTEAGFIKGLSALPKVKEAKVQLEKSIALNPKALDGSAYTSLGSLYYQVPGWPIAFGDKEKAEKYLKTALIMNAQGIDPNYFYGDFLLQQDRFKEAVPVLEKALAAPDRPDRTLADEGRRQEIRAALAEARKKAKMPTLDKDYN